MSDIQTALVQIYTGSVKTVYRDPKHAEANLFAFTDDYSVFDWGKMPDAIPDKGRALSLMGGHLFRQLSDPATWVTLSKSALMLSFDSDVRERVFNSDIYAQCVQSGLPNHFLSWAADDGMPIGVEDALQSNPMLRVRAVTVKQPHPFLVSHHTLYAYGRLPQPALSLIPLEVVFRFGLPPGSSLAKRLASNPGYAAEIGLSDVPEPGALFDRPVIEFFTKLEPTDRFLTFQEAYLMSGLTPEQFGQLYDMAQLLALWLYVAFAIHDIRLWDGKFEFALGPDGLMLVDSIGPDELRLVKNDVQLSKEVIRQFYRGSDWANAGDRAKKLAATRPGSDWKSVCAHELGQSPKPLDPDLVTAVSDLYAALTNTLLEEKVFPGTPDLDSVVEKLRLLQLDAGHPA